MNATTERTTFLGCPLDLASPEEIHADVVYQVGALMAFCTVAGVPMQHVKAHGALYNMAAKDEGLARAICQAVKDVDASLVLYGLAGSKLIDAARAIVNADPAH